MTKLRGPAWLRIAAVSTISTMNVERPRARSSAAPTRLKRRSTMPIRAARAGTNEPIWARIRMRAFWRRKVLLPAMLGPVTSQIVEKAQFKRERAVGGAGDLARELAQFDRRVAQRPGHRLAVDEVGGELAALPFDVRGRDFDVIADDVVVADA